jgi:hypothetical protein
VSTVDWTDPCAALAALRPAYYALISGEQVAELRHNGKVIVNHKTKAETLAAEIAKLEIACAASKGEQRGKRFAIRAG